jgi:26S proteasome regulatory subunit N6
MKEVALAHKQQSLLQFQKCAAQYERELFDDMVIRRHFNFLYNSLLEENLQKIILPYDQVQIDYVAQQIDLPMDKVLMKLSEMILDEKIRGTLDQGRNCLIIFEEQEPTEMFDHSLQTIKNLDVVMDSLYEKVHQYRQKYTK